MLIIILFQGKSQICTHGNIKIDRTDTRYVLIIIINE